MRQTDKLLSEKVLLLLEKLKYIKKVQTIDSNHNVF